MLSELLSEGDYIEQLTYLLCSALRARQKAKLDSYETVRQMLKMMDNDDYGLCYYDTVLLENEIHDIALKNYGSQAGRIA